MDGPFKGSDSLAIKLKIIPSCQILEVIGIK